MALHGETERLDSSAVGGAEDLAQLEWIRGLLIHVVKPP
jgi:hypothetical protein